VVSAGLGGVLILALLLGLWVVLAGPLPLSTLFNVQSGAARVGEAGADPAQGMTSPTQREEGHDRRSPSEILVDETPSQAAASLQGIEQALEALAADQRGDPDLRRAALQTIETRLSRLPPTVEEAQGPRLARLRQRLQEVKARIELEAVLPPEDAPLREPDGTR